MPQSQLCSSWSSVTPQDAAGPPVTLNIVAGSNSGSSARQSQQRAGPQCQCYSWRYYWCYWCLYLLRDRCLTMMFRLENNLLSVSIPLIIKSSVSELCSVLSTPSIMVPVELETKVHPKVHLLRRPQIGPSPG